MGELLKFLDFKDILKFRLVNKSFNLKIKRYFHMIKENMENEMQEIIC